MKNIYGLTFVESIISLGILGIVITPIISMFVLSTKINVNGANTLSSIFVAQRYMEEVKAMEEIDHENYNYNPADNCYERTIVETEYEYGVIIKIIPERNLLYNIEIHVFDNGVIVDSLKGSKIK